MHTHTQKHRPHRSCLMHWLLFKQRTCLRHLCGCWNTIWDWLDLKSVRLWKELPLVFRLTSCALCKAPWRTTVQLKQNLHYYHLKPQDNWILRIFSYTKMKIIFHKFLLFQTHITFFLSGTERILSNLLVLFLCSYNGLDWRFQVSKRTQKCHKNNLYIYSKSSEAIWHVCAIKKQNKFKRVSH